MKWTTIGALLTVLLQAVSASPLQQSVAKGSIEGVVTRAGTGQRIPGARVTLGRETTAAGVNAALSPTISSAQVALTSAGPSAITDSQGRFFFKDLEPGSYRLTVGANGYAKLESGQKTSSSQGKPIVLNSGQVLDVSIPLTPAGNVSGRIHDNQGQPLTGIQVQLLRSSYNSFGQRTFQTAGTARTDDRGEYRLFWITPGRYYLLASGGTAGVPGTGIGSPNELAAEMIPPTFYPDSTDISQAAIVDVKAGSDSTALDVSVSRNRLYRIRGRIIDGRFGQLPAPVTITVVTLQPAGGVGNLTSSQINNAPDGSFELRNVSPGPHVIRAQYSGMSTTVTSATAGLISTLSAQSATAQVALNVTSDMDGVVLTLVNGVSLSGRIRMEGQASIAGMDRPKVQLRQSVDGIIATGVGGPAPQSPATNSDGTFRVDTVTPGEYRLLVAPLPLDAYIQQARFNQSDILTKPMQFNVGDTGTLDIVLNNRGGQIDGVVLDERQHAVREIQAVLIPDRQRDRIDLYKTGTTDANGRFTIRGIAPGDYRVFAWEAIDAFAYFDPDLLRRYDQKGTPIHIVDLAKESIELRMLPAEP